MEVGETDKNEIKINVEQPILNQEENQNDKNNIEFENNELKDDSNEKKISLKKNVRKLKRPNDKNENQNEQIKDNEIKDIEIKDIEIKVNNNVNNSQEIENENYDINNNFELNNEDGKKKELIIDKNKNEGYLDDDLEDEENKKIYLRVIKRIEKTYGVPVISAIIPGEPIEDIEIEENIRPILVNNNDNIMPRNNIPKPENLHNKQMNINNINMHNNKRSFDNKNKINNNKSGINYEYQINKNKKGMKTKMDYSLNNNIINYNNYTPNYSNKSQLYNRNPKIRNIYKSELKYIQKTSQFNNIYPTNIHNINSRVIPNKTQIGNNYYSQLKYSYNNPLMNYQIKSNEKYKPAYNARYQGYINDKINNDKKTNYIPVRNKNNNIRNTQSLFADIRHEYPQKYNNNIISKTYYICSNSLNNTGTNKSNQKKPLNNNKNIFYSSIYQSLLNKKKSIMPKGNNIPNNNKKGTILQKNKFSSPYMANNSLKNLKKTSVTPINQKRNIIANKSQNRLNVKNRNNYLSHFYQSNNYGKDRKNNYNNFARTIDILNLSKKTYNSLQSYEIKINSNNYNKSLGEYKPQARTYVTYCIDSNYY